MTGSGPRPYDRTFRATSLDRPLARRHLAERADLQVKVGDIRVDLFLPFDAYHDAVQQRTRKAPLGDIEVQVLAPEDIVIFKVLFDRPKDWVDLEALARLRDDLDRRHLWLWADRLLDGHDPRRGRLASLFPPAETPR